MASRFLLSLVAAAATSTIASAQFLTGPSEQLSIGGTQAVRPLSFPFQFPGSAPTGSVHVSKWGRVTAEDAPVFSIYSLTELLNGPASINPYWTDTSGGTVRFGDYGYVATVTWSNVTLGTSAPFTFQLQLYPDGSFKYVYDDNVPVGAISFAGHSQGNGAADPGGSDLSANGDSGAAATVYQHFFIFTDFDLRNRTVTFTPNGQGGYVRTTEVSPPPVAAGHPTAVLPAGYENIGGNQGSGVPWGETTTSMFEQWRRTQNIYDSSSLTSQGVQGPILISKLRFRESDGFASNTGENASEVIIRMATMSNDHLSASSTFADNLGPDVRTVYHGTPPLVASTGAVPNNWCIEVVLDTPFLYDPSSGRDLVLDFDRRLPLGQLFFCDTVIGPNANGTTVVQGGSGPGGALDGIVDTERAMIFEMTYELVAPTTPLAPDLLNYQFNEVRGYEVANVASSSAFPETGRLSREDWHAESGRPLFGGVMGQGTPEQASRLVTNGSLNHQGSMTISWWQRRGAIPGGIVQAFGGETSGAPFFAQTSGPNDRNLSFTTSFAGISKTFTTTAEFLEQPGIWQHVCIAVDDDAGVARFWIDGIPAGFGTFDPGTHATPLVTNLRIGWHLDPSTSYGMRFDLDDFRIYGYALTREEVLYEARIGSERASASASGFACGAGSQAAILGVGGAPLSGNAAFAVEASNLDDTVPALLLVGLETAEIAVPWLDPLLGPGCRLHVVPIDYQVGATTNGRLSMSLPIPVGFAGTHVYAQGMQITATGGVATRMLDVNIQDL